MAFDMERMKSDPDYAPCKQKLRGKYAWRPPKRYIEMGYPSEGKKLPGIEGDHQDRRRAKLCRDYTMQMLRFFGPEQVAEIGTWAWVIERWKADPIGKYKKCRHKTRQDYDYRTKKWDAVIGHMQIKELDYVQIGAILHTMEEKNYSADLKQRLMIMLRTLARYAKGPLKQKAARDLCDILEEIRMETPPRRTMVPTEDQVMSVIAEADRRGMKAFATGIMIQWVTALRAVDVRGQWEPVKPGDEGGIVHKGKVWRDGLTWDMFSPDLSSFEKVPSKTRRSSSMYRKHSNPALPACSEWLVRSSYLNGQSARTQKELGHRRGRGSEKTWDSQRSSG